MEDSSLISIIMPYFNQEQYMDEPLQSVFDQTHENWECTLLVRKSILMHRTPGLDHLDS